MGWLDLSAIGLLLGVGTGALSFWWGRKLRQKRLDERRQRERAAKLADESRQSRRARQRREYKDYN